MLKNVIVDNKSIELVIDQEDVATFLGKLTQGRGTYLLNKRGVLLYRNLDVTPTERGIVFTFSERQDYVVGQMSGPVRLQDEDKVPTTPNQFFYEDFAQLARDLANINDSRYPTLITDEQHGQFLQVGREMLPSQKTLFYPRISDTRISVTEFFDIDFNDFHPTYSRAKAIEVYAEIAEVKRMQRHPELNREASYEIADILIRHDYLEAGQRDQFVKEVRTNAVSQEAVFWALNMMSVDALKIQKSGSPLLQVIFSLIGHGDFSGLDREQLQTLLTIAEIGNEDDAAKSKLGHETMDKFARDFANYEQLERLAIAYKPELEEAMAKLSEALVDKTTSPATFVLAPGASLESRPAPDMPGAPIR